MTTTISVHRRKPLAEEPRTGHNRWHPDIEPILEVGDGEDVALETRDACDGYLTPRSTAADFAGLPAGAIHPLTGPIAVKGARPGDLLEVEFREIVPQPWAFSGIFPGLGYLRDVMTTPYLVHWTVADGWATSPQLPRVRVPGAPFMGVSGVAPSRDQVAAWTRREADAAARGGMALPPDAGGGGGATRRRGGDARAPHGPHARELRELRREAADGRVAALPARQRGRRALLDGRRALRPGGR